MAGNLRILVYKRTHTGDPGWEGDKRGVFGCHNCMKSVRAKQFDAVIGVGGVGGEAQHHGIARRLTWVGVGPIPGPPPPVKPGEKPHPTIRFSDFFRIWDANGPLLAPLAPHLARRFYGDATSPHHVRFLLNLTAEEHVEAMTLIEYGRTSR